jgi:hypothetical protein
MKGKIPELFVPFLPDTETTAYSFDDAMSKMEESYSFKEEKAYLNNITLGEKTISVNGQMFLANRFALESLCKLCKLSLPTTYSLSPNYSIDLINKIVGVDQRTVCIFLDESESRVVNIVKANYYRASNLDVIVMFRELDSKYSWNYKEIKICERGIELSLVTDIFGQIEPSIGDITKTGFSVRNSDTGGRPLKASFYIFRLQCQNGAVLEDKWGEVRWSYDKRMPIQTSLSAFKRKLENMQLPNKLLETKIDALLRTKITDLDFRKIWRKLSRIVGQDEADTILETEKDERKRILKALKEREIKNRKCLHLDQIAEPIPLDISLYEIMQLVTAKAKIYPVLMKRQLEKVGGGIIG